MSKHWQNDMDHIQRQVLSLSITVEEMIENAARSLLEMNVELATGVIETDNIVNTREVRIEEECLKMLALHQPVAVELRRITTVFKVNYHLESIADLAVNIAERAQCLFGHPQFIVPKNIDKMAKISKEMVRGDLNAFVNLDSTAARVVLQLDEEVDALNCEVIVELQDMMREHPNLVVPALHCFSASRHIEQIADLAENMAEDVVYLVEGEIVRHRHGSVPLPH